MRVDLSNYTGSTTTTAQPVSGQKDEFLRLNQASEAPVLLDGELVVCDSRAIAD